MRRLFGAEDSPLAWHGLVWRARAGAMVEAMELRAIRYARVRVHLRSERLLGADEQSEAR